jgi:nitroimidazol reductase NimA-like FMN-containing flavoprotein (pyridoxamine 5'-phosphate oxidase superfamily)
MIAHDDALSARECWELLATVSVGRLALSVRALPVIVPVQYYLDGRRLAVCLGHHELPERSLDVTINAFAADSIDPVTRSGWSVQVQAGR